MVWDYYRELETINYDISKYSVIARCPVGSELRIKTYWDASPPFMQIESYIGFNFKNPSSSAPFLISSTETFEYNLNNHRMLENFIKHANLITAEINGNNVV